jgi:hypothetical protein
MTKRPDNQPKLREFGTGLRDRLYHPARWGAHRPPERVVRRPARAR